MCARCASSNTVNGMVSSVGSSTSLFSREVRKTVVNPLLLLLLLLMIDGDYDDDRCVPLWILLMRIMNFVQY